MASTKTRTPRQPKTIILCFDGTDNQFGTNNTNVVKLCSLLDKSCPLDQIFYYQPGIGTYFKPGVVNKGLESMAKRLDDLFAWYIEEHIMEGYKFLMQNYHEEDRICLFGFSRGAYTARALAAFLGKIGLLPRDNDEQLPFAYRLNRRGDEEGGKLAGEFKRTFCSTVTIKFLGVWDTVASIGTLYSRGPSIKYADSTVEVFRHALSLDERRARFQPSLYIIEPQEIANRQYSESSNPVNASSNPESGDETRNGSRFTFRFKRRGAGVQRHSREERLIPGTDGVAPENPEVPNQESAHHESTSEIVITPHPIPRVLEVWFAGCHSDVGGGAVEDKILHSLENISLRWMVKQIRLSRCGVLFDPAAIRKYGLDISTVGFLDHTVPITEEGSVEIGAALSSPQVPPGSPGDDGADFFVQGRKLEVVEERPWFREQDVSADVNDELKRQPWKWWFLELILPAKYTWQDPDGSWRSKLGWNYWHGRQIRQEAPIFHSSVRQKIDATGGKYKPNAQWVHGTERYTVGHTD